MHSLSTTRIYGLKGLVMATAAALFMACGGSPADKLEGYQDKVLTILENNKGDLDKAAKEVESFISSNKDDFQKATKELMEWAMKKFADDPAGAEKFQKDMEDRMKKFQARMEALEKAVPGIKEHEGLQKAMASLAEGMLD
jgi:hypothetical protein